MLEKKFHYVHEDNYTLMVDDCVAEQILWWVEDDHLTIREAIGKYLRELDMDWSCNDVPNEVREPIKDWLEAELPKYWKENGMIK